MARSAVESGIALAVEQPATHWETSIWPLVCSVGVLLVPPLAFSFHFDLFPKMTGRMYSEVLGWIGFILTFAGINLVFFPMMIAGLYGMPRRYFDYEQFPEVAGLQNFMSIGSVVILLGAIVILWSWIHGLLKGGKASANPWGSRSLEWTTPSPPPPGNFGHKLPVITPEWHPYGYGRARPATGAG